MDENIRKLTAPMVGNGLIIGGVQEIHEKGLERDFQVSEYELESLARHWAETIRDLQDFWDTYQQSSSRDSRLIVYANYRLKKIEEHLGSKCVQEIFEKVMGERRCWRNEFEPRVAADYGLHAAIILESLIQSAELQAELATTRDQKQRSLLEFFVTPPKEPTDPAEYSLYPYLTQAEIDAAIRTLVDGGLLRERKAELADQSVNGRGKEEFSLTPLALGHGRQNIRETEMIQGSRGCKQ